MGFGGATLQEKGSGCSMAWESGRVSGGSVGFDLVAMPTEMPVLYLLVYRIKCSYQVKLSLELAQLDVCSVVDRCTLTISFRAGRLTEFGRMRPLPAKVVMTPAPWRRSKLSSA